MHGWSCKPFLCWKQHLVVCPTHPSSCPWCLAVWGHERAATAGESNPLCGAPTGSRSSKGSLCLSLLGVLGISLCRLSKHERVIWFCQDRQSCSGLCQEDELSANSRQGVLQLSLEPLGLALVVRRLRPARSGVDEVLHT